MTYLELKLRLPELLLDARGQDHDGDFGRSARAVSRSSSGRVRARRCRAHLKVEGKSGKHILKRALEDILPHDLLYSRKRGFRRARFASGSATAWSAASTRTCSMRHMRRREFFDYDFVARLVEEHRRGRAGLELSPVGVPQFESVVRALD